MGDIVDLMAWSAASNAEDAARDAESAARDAEIATQNLINIQNKQKADSKIEILNRCYQDIYYKREIEAYNLKIIREFVNANNKQLNYYKFPAKTYFPSFPWKALFFIALFSYLTYIDFFPVFSMIAIFITLLISWSDFSDWNYWRKESNREEYEKNRLKTIEKTYAHVVKNLIQDYPGLSIYGWIAKYTVDMNIKHTYEYFKKENSIVAEASLIRFYELALDISIREENRKSTLKMFYEQPDEILNLAKSNRLFCVESLEYYKA